MISDLNPYPSMKDTGVPWLGDVPTHWDVLPNRAIFSEVKEQGYPDEQMLSVTITRGVIHQQALLADSSKKDSSNLDKSKYKLVRPGDIAYNKMRAWQGALGVSAYQGIVSPAYVVQRPRDGVNPKYVHYLLRTRAFAKEAERWSYGITSDMWSLRPEHFRMIYTCLPPDAEQATIVRFLDHADLRIQRHIRAKKKLIKLLEEQKQAIIHRAVTRGRDPNVRLKSSGVEWLGDVPEHWHVLPIKRAFISMEYGISESATDTGHIRLLTMGNIKDGKVTIPDSGGVPSVDDMLLLKPGDILFNRTNSAELVGKVGLFRGAESPVTFASYLVRMCPRAEHEPEYLNTVLNDISILSLARREAIPSLHQSNLNPTRYGRLQICLPPLEEQQSILLFLKESTHELDRAIDAAHREISLLQEYRIRLIADVVTGKLDVREAAASLLDEAEVHETSDEAETMIEDEEVANDVDSVTEVSES